MLSSMYNRDADNISISRKRQIDTLVAFNEKVTTVRENVEYRLEFGTSVGAMCLSVLLPPEFPREKPHITVHPPVIHPWVPNNRDVTNAPGILNFTMHSDLGRVTSAIIREWQTRPPPIQHSGSSAVTEPPAALPLPSSDDFPTLTSLPASTLQSLGTSNERLEEFVSTLPHWKTWDNAVQAKIAEIECIARENLSKEQDLTDLKKQVTETVTEAQTAKAEFDEKSKEYARLSEVYEPENIRVALQGAARESDLAAEDIAERFLAGDIDVDHFLLDYVEMRKVSQIRKSKEEKLGKQLMELHKAGF